MLLDAIAARAREDPAPEAVVTTSERVDYGTLWRRACALATRLMASGVRADAIVLLELPDGADFVVAWLAALLAGARPLPLPPGTTPAERAQLLAGQPVSAILAIPGPMPPSPGAAIMEPPYRLEAARARGTLGAAEMLVATSGSTGMPRAVRLSLAGVSWNAAAHAESVGLESGDRLGIVSPMTHAATLVAQVAAALQLGATLVVLPRPFTAGTFLEAVGQERVTATALTPTHVRWLLASRAAPALAAADLATWRLATVGTASIDPALLRDFAELLAARAGGRVYVTYGLTEAGPRVTTLGPAGADTPAGAVGYPLPGVAVRVVDPRRPDRELPPGAEGELEVQTPGRMIGYLGSAPPAFVWLPTGDVASVGADGLVTLRGRLKEVIVSGGAKISPSEVESALQCDARVQEAAVVPEPHDALGAVVKAFVVPAAPVTPAEILAELATRLSPYKLPRRLVLVDSLPYTPSGKVDKRRLGETAPVP